MSYLTSSAVAWTIKSAYLQDAVVQSIRRLHLPTLLKKDHSWIMVAVTTAVQIYRNSSSSCKILKNKSVQRAIKFIFFLICKFRFLTTPFFFFLLFYLDNVSRLHGPSSQHDILMRPRDMPNVWWSDDWVSNLPQGCWKTNFALLRCRVYWKKNTDIHTPNWR